MSFEDRYDAMSDYNAEQQREGYNEAVGDIKAHFLTEKRQTYSKKEILQILGGF